MVIVVIGMYCVFVFGGIFKFCCFMDWQCIYIGVQIYDFVVVSLVFDYVDNIGVINVFNYFIIVKGVQFFGDQGRGMVGFKQDFGMCVNVVLLFGDICVQFGKMVFYWYIFGFCKIRLSSGVD